MRIIAIPISLNLLLNGSNTMRIIAIPISLNLLLNGSNTLPHEENNRDIKCMFQFANTYC